MQPKYHDWSKCTFTVAIITKTILLLSYVIFRSKCVMGGIHYKSKLQLTRSQTLIYVYKWSTLTLTYCPPMTKLHCSAKHGNCIGHEHQLYSQLTATTPGPVQMDHVSRRGLW